MKPPWKYVGTGKVMVFDSIKRTWSGQDYFIVERSAVKCSYGKVGDHIFVCEDIPPADRRRAVYAALKMAEFTPHGHVVPRLEVVMYDAPPTSTKDPIKDAAQ